MPVAISKALNHCFNSFIFFYFSNHAPIAAAKVTENIIFNTDSGVNNNGMASQKDKHIVQLKGLRYSILNLSGNLKTLINNHV